MDILARTQPDRPLRSNGYARHYVGDALQTEFARLSVGRFAAERGVYLFYLDAAGDALADTWHPDLAQALDQARLEFDLRPLDWVFAPGVAAPDAP